MKDQLIKVTTTNLDDVSSTKVFTKIDFSNKKDTVIDFPIPAKLKTISINVEGSITFLKETKP